MTEQNYRNHIRFYVIHHFVFYPVVILFSGMSIWYGWTHQERLTEWLAIAVLCLMIGWLSYMMRQHYALINQNRIVRLEMRFRYYTLTQQRFDPIEVQLSFGQIAALRFASDDELPVLIFRTLNEHLSAKEIKKSIKDWVPDHMRV